MPLTTTATWPSLVNRTASAADVNNKFAWLEGDRLPMNNGILTTDVYDIGSDDTPWRNGVFSSVVIGGQTTSVSLRFGKISAWGKITVSGGTVTADGTYGVNSLTYTAVGRILIDVNSASGGWQPPIIFTARGANGKMPCVESNEYGPFYTNLQNLTPTKEDYSFNFIRSVQG